MGEEFIYNAAELINVIFENLIMVLFCHQIFERKFRSAVPYIAGYTVTFFVLLVTEFFIEQPSVRTMIAFGVILVIAVFLYYGSAVLKFFVSIYWVMMIYVTDLLFIGILTFMGYGNALQLLQQGTGRMLGMIGIKILDFWMVVYTCRIYKKKAKSLPLKYWILILMMPFFSIVMIKLVFDANETDKNVMGFYIVCVGGLIYLNFLVFHYFESYDKQIRLAALEKIIEKEEENYQRLAASYNEIRDIRHDLKDQLEVLNHLIENKNYEEAQNHMHRLYHTTENVVSVCYTGNLAVDSIINLKGAYARNHDIRFKTKIKVKQIDFDTIGLCRILGNILDNAVEACERIDEGEKYIFCMIYQIEKKLMIEVDNTSLKVDVNHLSTSKENKLIHGIGIRSIKQMAQNMNGHVSYHYEDGIFSIKVVLLK